jgi:hypothetical protein
VSELEKEKLAISEELAMEQLNAKTTKSKLKNKVSISYTPCHIATLFTLHAIGCSERSSVPCSLVTDSQDHTGRGDAQSRERSVDEAGARARELELCKY